jgi:putative ABC transport system permease protein
MGAILGIILGLVGANIVAAISPLPAAIAPVWITASIIMGGGVGIVAGIYPAAKAAKLDPVVALRAE